MAAGRFLDTLQLPVCTPVFPVSEKLLLKGGGWLGVCAVYSISLGSSSFIKLVSDCFCAECRHRQRFGGHQEEHHGGEELWNGQQTKA